LPTCASWLGHIPKERREFAAWRNVEKTLLACALGDDPANISIALQLVLQAERVPYQIKQKTRDR
jgi:hypothetical protein